MFAFDGSCNRLKIPVVLSLTVWNEQRFFLYFKLHFAGHFPGDDLIYHGWTLHKRCQLSKQIIQIARHLIQISLILLTFENFKEIIQSL